MISVSQELKVNPDQSGLAPLSRSDLWKGLKMKAENALPFVQGMSKCDVVERTENGLIRDIEFQGKPARERITFYPEKKVVFLRLSGDADGIIVNEILGTDDDLRVRFSFAFQLTEAESGSREEEELRKAVETAYVAAVDATLNGIRSAKANGSL
ncbi:protein of unknown function [Paraburkholderia steynii]|uniref:DUF1857 domain-containing protein n=1 Tax=Paraburkholderia steynii TaxID=1245441 RepID=A0A7Z7FFA5_9BURK|nr:MULTISPECIES: SRPBCC family protein [Paraburkholderia]EUC18808.1 protein of unknown function DUF1857 [Burkholderia sp. BT03]SDH25599.1 protein of unknown function [Paraburkholderia steynii]SKC60790.1 protein of unknown function [Paraburkholderia hospita]